MKLSLAYLFRAPEFVVEDIASVVYTFDLGVYLVVKCGKQC